MTSSTYNSTFILYTLFTSRVQEREVEKCPIYKNMLGRYPRPGKGEELKFILDTAQNHGNTLLLG